jgi:hypothetical protein
MTESRRTGTSHIKKKKKKKKEGEQGGKNKEKAEG